MSYITDVMILDARQQDVDALNAWLLEADERQQQFNRIDMDAAGGVKVFCTDTWAAAFNYGPMSELRDKLADMDTWSTVGVKWIMDTEGDFVTIGYYNYREMLLLEPERL